MCETKRLPFKLCWNYTSYIQNGNSNMILNLFCWRILYQIHVTNIFYYHQCYLYSICIYRQNCINLLPTFFRIFRFALNFIFYIFQHMVLFLNYFRFYSTHEVSPFTYHKRSTVRFNSQGLTNIKPSYAYLC